ncbi:MAG: hypothetical protein H6Q69_351 [Firmicutes bacterium]|jgi:hypothetical protein|nr:hypothetical protein [Bacillota bacterium]
MLILILAENVMKIHINDYHGDTNVKLHDMHLMLGGFTHEKSNQ